MRLHLLAVPHTVTRPDFSHCAFTGKVERFSPMMRAQGFEVIHYGVETSVSGASENVVLMTEAEHLELLGHPYHEQGSGFYGDDATEGSAVYRQWNYAARQELMSRLEPGDVIALPFGRAHESAIRDLPLLRARRVAAFESGIGYKDCFLPYRVYESEACRHSVMAKEGRAGVAHESNRLEWVVPNYYRTADWRFNERGGDHVVFLGRIGAAKGVDLIPRLAAERTDITFILAGQGDPQAYLGLPNVHYEPPIKGAGRSEYLGDARAIIAPSRYVEPFCGAVVEAALCGTPAITSVFGAFTETVEQGKTGFRCQTLKNWLDALDAVKDLDREHVRARAESRYSLEAVGPQYAAVLADISTSLINAP
jgi:glycosyltransferase involved in cell wall biosynthesis